MIIKNLKINGINEPVGYGFETISLSYEIESAEQLTENPVLTVFDGEMAVHKQELDFGQSFCTPVSFRPEKEKRYKLKVSCEGTEGESFFETGTDFDCRFITPEAEISHPVLYKNFSLPCAVLRARLYMSGVGLYRAYLGGVRVGAEYLTPYCNDYDEYLQYQTYDVSSMLGKDNLIEIVLGDGWYKGRFGLQKRDNIYGDRCMAAAKLVVTFTDGSQTVIGTDESWLARRSHIVSSGIYDGETSDEYNADTLAVAVKYAEKRFNISPRISPPVVVKHTLTPELYISPKGEKILDFKQNFSGVVAFTSRLGAGQTVRLVMGEVLQNGCFYRENLRTAKAAFVYTSDGRQKEIEPLFTFYGFRYCLLEGFDNVNPDDFTGKVLYSDIEQTTQISTDNEKINRLLQNCVWGQRSNFVDVPTDCPQRDERLGWTGDAQVFSRTACYQMDCKAFYRKYLKDIGIDQKLLGGRIPTYSPSMKELSPAYCAWEDAAAIIPWNLYGFYGDKDLLGTHFEIIGKFADTLIAMDDNHGGGRLYNFGFHLGDWLAQDGVSESALRGATDEYFIASMYYFNTVRIAESAAEALGLTDKRERYKAVKNEIYKSIIKEYFSPSGRLTVDTQTAYTLSLGFCVYKNKDRTIGDFKKRLIRDNYKIKGGFVGATSLVQVLIANGLTDEAFRILYAESFPGWLYCVNLGATTVWERWNSLLPDGTISGTEMNSLNHYAYGAVAEAFYAYIAGLRPLTAGFKEAIIQPVFNYRLKKLDFSFKSYSGEYAVCYTVLKDCTAILRVKVPFGATATLKIDGIGFKTRRLSGGSYEFKLNLPDKIIRPFSINSAIGELMLDSRASSVLKQALPPLYVFLSRQDIGIGGEPLSFIKRLDSVKIPDELLNKLDGLLRAIEV